ncbi:MAG: hypothetical protein Q7R35_14860 [Elusimicrobiota bacterium]|nr:hypothetical protein [Elusimicrobiota bacterium]
MKTLSYLAAAAISVSGIFSASAGESQVLGKAGLSLPSIELPSPEAQPNKSSFAVKLGTITGTMNRSIVDLKINKLAWTITGAMNYSPIDVKINHDDKTITGGANHSPIALTFAWSTEEVSVDGGANHSPVKYTVNWKNGLLEGYSNHAPLRLEFDMSEGLADATIVTVKGYANRAPVELTYNKVNGHIGGYMDRSPVDVNLVNCDLYDFLQYFFLFMREVPF